MSVILVGNSLNCTLMFSLIHNNGSVQQWKDSIRGKKLLRSFGSVLLLTIGLINPLHKMEMRMEILLPLS